jgi:putative oxidoreductase
MKHYHIVSRIAIYLLSAVLIAFGIFSFMYPRDLMVYVPVSLPGGINLAYIVGAGFILVGLSFMTNQYVKFTGYIFAGLLLIFILAIHVPNYLHAGAEEMRKLALINLLKDSAIMAFALHIAAGAHHQHFHLEESD